MGSRHSAIKNQYFHQDGIPGKIRATEAHCHGHRPTMEDASMVCPTIEGHPGFSAFGVFDGHCGSATAQALKRRIPVLLREAKDMTTNTITNLLVDLDRDICKSLLEKSPLVQPSLSDAELSAAYGAGFQPVLLQKKLTSGSTGIVCVLEDRKAKEYTLRCANVGDSRCIVMRHEPEDGTYTCVKLSNDHCPSREDEAKRIAASLSTVVANRVRGQLAVSRAFGDVNYKNNPNVPWEAQAVIAVPEWTTMAVKDGDIILMFCDGINERMELKDVFDIVSFLLISSRDGAVIPEAILSRLIDQSMRAGSTDNMTALMIEIGSPVCEHRDVCHLHSTPVEGGIVHRKEEDVDMFQPVDEAAAKWRDPEMFEFVQSEQLARFEADMKNNGLSPMDALLLMCGQWAVDLYQAGNTSDHDAREGDSTSTTAIAIPVEEEDKDKAGKGGASEEGSDTEDETDSPPTPKVPQCVPRLPIRSRTASVLRSTSIPVDNTAIFPVSSQEEKSPAYNYRALSDLILSVFPSSTTKPSSPSSITAQVTTTITAKTKLGKRPASPEIERPHTKKSKKITIPRRQKEEEEEEIEEEK